MDTPALYQIYLKYPNVQTDSRKVRPGDLYFALKGERFDGNQFALQALQDGAAYAIVDAASAVHNEQCILVEDVLRALQQLALHHRRQFSIPFIAITGTNGKTTTKELVYKVLSARFKTYATEGNLNNHIGVPLTLLKVRSDAAMAIIEMGANHEREIAFYCTIAEPNYALINNVGKAHLEGFGSLGGVRRAKGELYDHIRATNGSIFINKDLDYLTQMAQGITHQITYGSSDAAVIGKALEGDLLRFVVLTAGMEAIIQTRLVGAYNLPNALAAVTIGHHFGMHIDMIKAALESYQPSNSRSQLLEKGSNAIVLDAYNANPSSMKLAIENMAQMDTPRSKWLLLGAMKEMGDNCVEEHQALVDLAKELGFINVVLVGEEFERVMHDFVQFENSSLAAHWLKQHLPQDAIILIKGSRGSAMEAILPALEA